MEIKGTIDGPLTYGLNGSVALPQARDWRDRAALLVSRVLNPPLVGSFGVCLAAGYFATPIAWTWALLELAMMTLLPVLFVVWLLWQGRVSDLDLRLRKQRIGPYLLTIVTSSVAVAICAAMNMPRPMVWLAAAGTVQIICMCAVTTRWKISLHTAAIASFAVVVLHFAGPVALPVLLAVPLVAWARLRLHRHNLPQTIAGALVGASIYLTALQLAYVS